MIVEHAYRELFANSHCDAVWNRRNHGDVTFSTGPKLGMNIATTTERGATKSKVSITGGEMLESLINRTEFELEVQHAMLRSRFNSHRVSPQSAD